MVINSQEMTISLPQDKVNRLQVECQSLLHRDSVTVRCLSKLLGKMTATLEAVTVAPLHYRSLQKDQLAVLSQTGSYDAPLSLSLEAKEELKWWMDCLARWNGRSLLPQKPDRCIQVRLGSPVRSQYSPRPVVSDGTEVAHQPVGDASGLQGTRFSGKSSEGCMCRSQMRQCNCGDIHQSSRGNTLLGLVQNGSQHVAVVSGPQHSSGSKLSSRKDKSGGRLPVKEVQRQSGVVSQARSPSCSSQTAGVVSGSRSLCITSECTIPSLRLMETKSSGMADRCLFHSMEQPLGLLSRVLHKVRQEGARVVLVAPVWTTQPWYADLLTLLVQDPFLLPQMRDLVTDPVTGDCHPLADRMLLAVWPLSGVLSEQEAYQKGCPKLSSLVSEKEFNC
ncbi:uncharacterized protein [Ptychodera flava]|uniref:uncharacterized protein n=1 Tax=Ptychodera flava TaxID=63121 RepID=UPI00396A891A